jgi:hypothetical protein
MRTGGRDREISPRQCPSLISPPKVENDSQESVMKLAQAYDVSVKTVQTSPGPTQKETRLYL